MALGRNRSRTAGAADGRRRIPSVERVLGSARVRALLARFRRDFIVDEIRALLDDLRRNPEEGAHRITGESGAADDAGGDDLSGARGGSPPARRPVGRAAPPDGADRDGDDLDARLAALVDRLESRLERNRQPRLRRVVNATGVVLHTNLGRALLAPTVVARVAEAAAHPVTLEYDLARGGRGERDAIVEADLTALTGAEAATVVNNNAAAVFLALNTLADGRDVLVSRGELIEIGGSFRIPDIMAKSGGRLREVGTTNRTHLDDYRRALGPETGLLLKVHTSNYRIVGFTAEVALAALVALGREAGVPVMVDLGSGALADLTAYGLPGEPVVADIVASGADVVTFSGDKLLGGPQAGIVVGKRAAIDRMRKNPIRRAVRPGKLELAALEATLRLYRESPDLAAELPTVRWLARPLGEMETVGRAAAALLAERLGPGYTIELVESEGEVGSGALPEARLPSRALAVRHPDVAPDDIARRFRAADPPVIGRVHGGVFLLDLRGIFAPDELAVRLEPIP